MIVITSKDFNRDVSAAKRAAESGPVTITDHGKRSHMLLTAADYDRLVNRNQSLGDRLRMAGGSEIELQIPPRTQSSQRRIPDL